MVTHNELIRVAKDMKNLLETPEYEPLKLALRLSPEFVDEGVNLVLAFEQNRNRRGVLKSQKQDATKTKNRAIREVNAQRREFGELMRRKFAKDPVLVSLDLDTRYRTVSRDGEEVREPWRSRSEGAVRSQTQMLLENIDSLSDSVRATIARSGWGQMESDDLRDAFDFLETACMDQKQKEAEYNLAVRAGQTLFGELKDWYGLVRSRTTKVLRRHGHLAGLANQALPSLRGGQYQTGEQPAEPQAQTPPAPQAPEVDDDSQNPDSEPPTGGGSTQEPTNQNNGRNEVGNHSPEVEPVNDGKTEVETDKDQSGRPPQADKEVNHGRGSSRSLKDPDPAQNEVA